MGFLGKSTTGKNYALSYFLRLSAVKRPVYFFTKDRESLSCLPNVVHKKYSTSNINEVISLLSSQVSHACVVLDDVIISSQTAGPLRALIDVYAPKMCIDLIIVTHNITYVAEFNALATAFDKWLIPLHNSNAPLHQILCTKLGLHKDGWPDTGGGFSSGFWMFDRNSFQTLIVYYANRPASDHSTILALCPLSLRPRLQYYLHFLPCTVLNRTTYVLRFKKRMLHLLDFCRLQIHTQQLDRWTRSFIKYLRKQGVLIPSNI